jgi:hypothetical protein
VYGLRLVCRAEPRAAKETVFALSVAAFCASWEGRLDAGPTLATTSSPALLLSFSSPLSSLGFWSCLPVYYMPLEWQFRECEDASALERRGSAALALATLGHRPENVVNPACVAFPDDTCTFVSECV